MSVRDLNKNLVVSDCLTGQVIDVINYDLYRTTTINDMLYDIFEDYIYESEHGVMIKFGYKS